MALTSSADPLAKGPTSTDLLLSAALIASGPALWAIGVIIVQSDSTTQASALSAVGSPLEILERIVELWMSLEHSGIAAVERISGMSAVLLGLLISLGTVLATTASLAQALAHRRGAFGAEQVLSRVSPGFLQRSAILTLGAGLALSSSAAGSWSVTPDLTTSLHDGGGSSAAAETGPDSVLFTPKSAESNHPMTDRETKEEDMSGLFTPKKDRPNNDRGQGLPHRSPNQAEVTVLPGDTLWDIAADQLGPDATDWEIAESWPRWYSANRELIGEDPGIIHPGTVLHPPTR